MLIILALKTKTKLEMPSIIALFFYWTYFFLLSVNQLVFVVKNDFLINFDPETKDQIHTWGPLATQDIAINFLINLVYSYFVFEMYFAKICLESTNFTVYKEEIKKAHKMRAIVMTT